MTGNGYSEAGWQAHWGYLHDGTALPNGIVNVAAQAVGEFGTRYTGNMVNWLDDLITYLIKIDQRNTFFWCLNPNSGDTYVQNYFFVMFIKECKFNQKYTEEDYYRVIGQHQKLQN